MELTIITLLMILFALFAYSRVILRMRKGEITVAEFAFWSILWISVIVVALIPSFATAIAVLLGIGRGVDVMVYLSILVLFYLVFRAYVKMEHIEHELTLMTRNLSYAMSKYKMQKKK
jgi:hypothetical protein